MTIIEKKSPLELLLQQWVNAGFAEALAEIEPGFYSMPELGHRIAGTDIVQRKAFYRFVNALVRLGEIASLEVWHNKSPLQVVEIEENYLRELFAGAK